MDLRLTKERMRMFWEYGKGRVFIAIVVAVALFYTLYQLTRPVVPAAQRFDILQGGIYVDFVCSRRSAESWRIAERKSNEVKAEV